MLKHSPGTMASNLPHVVSRIYVGAGASDDATFLMRMLEVCSLPRSEKSSVCSTPVWPVPHSRGVLFFACIAPSTLLASYHSAVTIFLSQVGGILVGPFDSNGGGQRLIKCVRTAENDFNFSDLMSVNRLENHRQSPIIAPIV